MLDYLTTFFVSGGIITGSKYLSDTFSTKISKIYSLVDDEKSKQKFESIPSYAGILASLPIGIIGSFFLKNDIQKKQYYAGYLYSCIILAVTVFIMHVFSLTFQSVQMNNISVIGLTIWLSISSIVIFIFNTLKSN